MNALDPIVLDTYCSYIPVISTIEAIVNAICLAIINLIGDVESVYRQRDQGLYNYGVHLVDTKSLLRLFLMLIPGVGNIILAILDTPPREVQQIKECVAQGDIDRALTLCESAIDAGYGSEYIIYGCASYIDTVEYTGRQDIVTFYQQQLWNRWSPESVKKALYVWGPLNGEIIVTMFRGNRSVGEFAHSPEYWACGSLDMGRGEASVWCRHSHSFYGKRMKDLPEFLRMYDFAAEFVYGKPKEYILERHQRYAGSG